jgi:hypothetical protein
MQLKTCEGFLTFEGKPNPKCEQTFICQDRHYHSRQYCKPCQKLRVNAYHAQYMRLWRKKKK